MEWADGDLMESVSVEEMNRKAGLYTYIGGGNLIEKKTWDGGDNQAPHSGMGRSLDRRPFQIPYLLAHTLGRCLQRASRYRGSLRSMTFCIGTNIRQEM